MNRCDQFPEVKEIADAVCAEDVTQEQLTQLKQLLHNNVAAQEFYYDYLNMHIQLKQAADRNMEFVYRRMTEEFVMRPKDDANIKQIEPPNVITPPPAKNNLKILTFIALFIACLIWIFVSQHGTSSVAKLISGHLNILGQQGKVEDNAIFPGVYLSNTDTTVQLIDGDTIHLAPNSRIKFFNNKEVRVVYGKFTFESSPEQNTIVHNENFVTATNGSDLGFHLTSKEPKIISGQNTTFNPLINRPIHYWNFEGQNERIIDLAGDAYGVVNDGVSKIKGMVGQAAHFDNDNNGFIDFGSGGATALGTGSFSVSEGVTIEALIRPEFSKKLTKGGEVFTQIYGENNLRISLGFHQNHQQTNDGTNSDENINLHFGLFILGQGYQELTLPIDGKKGRPTLAELENGNFHHIAASYNAKSGLKAIYFNGEMLSSINYPKGLKVLSGGSGSTLIGNRSTSSENLKHAFSGAIDEVAFYDFAIPEYTLALHLDNIQQGKNYWGFAANDKKLPERIKIQLPPNSIIELDKTTMLPKKLVSQQK